MKNGIELMAAKRAKHPEKGYDKYHDQTHKHGELAIVAATLAVVGTDAVVIHPDEEWGTNDNPWGLEKNHDRIDQLAEAGSLIAAEIDRLQAIDNPELLKQPTP